MQPGKRKLVVGGSIGEPGSRQLDPAVVRLKANGRLDRSFAGDGKAILRRGAPADVAVQRNGKIVAAGSANRGEPGAVQQGLALARYRLGD